MDLVFICNLATHVCRDGRFWLIYRVVTHLDLDGRVGRRLHLVIEYGFHIQVFQENAMNFSLFFDRIEDTRLLGNCSCPVYLCIVCLLPLLDLFFDVEALDARRE